jgi:hypothetical protein
MTDSLVSVQKSRYRSNVETCDLELRTPKNNSHNLLSASKFFVFFVFNNNFKLPTLSRDLPIIITSRWVVTQKKHFERIKLRHGHTSHFFTTS